MIDIVYPLGRGSAWSNNELRYSLRSIEKHLSGINRIIVIGELPPWLVNAVHISLKDKFYKDRNIMEKLLYVSNLNWVTPDFLYMNDDHFLLSDFYSSSFPNYADGTLQQAFEQHDNFMYKKILLTTRRKLAEEVLPVFNFDVHCPMVINGTLFRSVIKKYDWTKPYGYCLKSLYANNICLSPEMITDLKIKKATQLPALKQKIEGRHFFSINDNAINKHMIALLEELYPAKSKYEK